MGYRIVGDGPYYAADLATNGRTKSRFHTHAEAQAWTTGARRQLCSRAAPVIPDHSILTTQVS